jgi:hypothetical protein
MNSTSVLRRLRFSCVRVRAATMVEGGAGRRKSDSGGEWLERCVDDGIVESGEDLESRVLG